MPINSNRLATDYFAAWNARDAVRLGALFDETGTFEEPTTAIAIRPFDLQAVIDALVQSFSDFSFELGRVTADTKLVYAEWILNGTNDGGVRRGVLPTGKRLHLHGIDILECAPDKIVRARRLYDRRAMVEQIGLQVLIEPFQQGATQFGYSLHASSESQAVPGIVALTWILGRDEAERDRVRKHSGQIVWDFLNEPGFIGIVTGFTGNRGFTCTAWQDEESLHRALDHQHSRAKQEFRTSGLSPGVWTSVWKPHHINAMWIRCVICDEPNDVRDNHRNCTKCGDGLPQRPAYW